MSVVYPTHKFSNIIISIVGSVKKLSRGKEKRYIVVVNEYNYNQSFDADLIYALSTQDIELISDVIAKSMYSIAMDNIMFDDDAVFVIPMPKQKIKIDCK